MIIRWNSHRLATTNYLWSWAA